MTDIKEAQKNGLEFEAALFSDLSKKWICVKGDNARENTWGIDIIVHSTDGLSDVLIQCKWTLEIKLPDTNHCINAMKMYREKNSSKHVEFMFATRLPISEFKRSAIVAKKSGVHNVTNGKGMTETIKDVVDKVVQIFDSYKSLTTVKSTVPESKSPNHQFTIQTMKELFLAERLVPWVGQRPASDSHINKIRQKIISKIGSRMNVKQTMTEIHLVYYTNGNRYEIIDGTHRIRALIGIENTLLQESKLNDWNLPVKVWIDLTYDECSELFQILNDCLPMPAMYIDKVRGETVLSGLSFRLRSFYNNSISDSDGCKLPFINVTQTHRDLKCDETLNVWSTKGVISSTLPDSKGSPFDVIQKLNIHIGNMISASQDPLAFVNGLREKVTAKSASAIDKKQFDTAMTKIKRQMNPCYLGLVHRSKWYNLIILNWDTWEPI